MKEQLRSEARQLPWTLTKLVGGLAAVIGFGGAVVVLTRRPDPSWSGVLAWVIAGVIGLVLFLAASRSLARPKVADGQEPTGKDRAKTSALSWTILFMLAALFIAIVLILAV
jgi:cobalamin biosynthesis protein CobD/CbiB